MSMDTQRQLAEACSCHVAVRKWVHTMLVSYVYMPVSCPMPGLLFHGYRPWPLPDPCPMRLIRGQAQVEAERTCSDELRGSRA